MKIISDPYSPAYPAAWLLFGMLFAISIAHSISVPLAKLGTVTVYALPMGWVAVLIWQRKREILYATTIDLLFTSFMILVLVSLTFKSESWKEFETSIRFLPFMAVTPYLCGRLIRESDIYEFRRVTLIGGVGILPLLLLDRFLSPGHDKGGHWPFFGQDHGALLVGALLATTLLSLCVVILGRSNWGANINRGRFWAHWVLIGLVTIFLVWVSARGWLIAGLVGIATICFLAKHHLVTKRVGLFFSILTIVGLMLVGLPRLDPMSGGMYDLKLLVNVNPIRASISKPTASVPVADNCEALTHGVNSIAIRELLYREAMVIFLAHPGLGVGAGQYGKYSCTGPGGFPHSTILQGFAELGLIGGGLLVAALILAVITLVRPFMSHKNQVSWSSSAFVLGLFGIYLVADQLYGNYFMSVGTWLMLGIASSIRSDRGSAKSG